MLPYIIYNLEIILNKKMNYFIIIFFLLGRTGLCIEPIDIEINKNRI